MIVIARFKTPIETVDVGMNELTNAIKSDYAAWTNRNDINKEIRNEFIKRFDDGVKVTYGKKYAKIMRDNAVLGFVVIVDNDKKFAKGDLLKAASWSAPARNFARGNLFTGGYIVNWTGI